jgi:hypothetical protein
MAPPPYYVVRSGPPGTVWAAAIVTWVTAGFSILMTFLMLAFVAFVGSIIGDSFTYDDQVSLGLIVIGFAVVSLLLSVAACYLAWRTTKGQQWARIALAAWAGVFAVLGALSLTPPGFLWTAAGTVVVVLLFVPESNAWFAEDR